MVQADHQNHNRHQMPLHQNKRAFLQHLRQERPGKYLALESVAKSDVIDRGEGADGLLLNAPSVAGAVSASIGVEQGELFEDSMGRSASVCWDI
jgi:hypothetical protein